MPNTPVVSRSQTPLTIAFILGGALLAAYGCVGLLNGFSVASIGMLMLGGGLVVLGLVRWKVMGDASRSVRTPMR